MQIQLTQAQFDAAAVRVKAATGVEMKGDGGQIQHDGELLQWRYDGTTLSVTAIRKKPFEPLGHSEARIRGWFAADVKQGGSK